MPSRVARTPPCATLRNVHPAFRWTGRVAWGRWGHSPSCKLFMGLTRCVGGRIAVAPRLVGLVADDLTGAADAAAQFAAEGWSAHVLCSPAARPAVIDEGLSVLAVVTGVRAARDDRAAADTAAGVRGLVAQGCDRLYVKIDSTMRGSVAGQLRGALDAWAVRCPGAVVVLCPAFPDEGRAVVGGAVLVDGILVDQSPAG